MNFLVLAIALGLFGCAKEKPAPLWEKVPALRRDLEVSVEASGAIEPVLTVDVKSKASGEIIDLRVETGEDVRSGQLLARIDPRLQQNTLAQADANLDVARAQLENAEAQKKRADQLYKLQTIAETEYENTNLTYATARAAVVRAKSDLENARDQMEDTSLKAPIAGTILQKNVELGTVISSPTKDVAGGTVLLRMANLDTMQVRALVDETDIGKVQPGTRATVTVEAYPSRSFRGTVRKIEPQAVVQQNVTMFPVLVGIENPGHLLRPGMNTEVELAVGSRQNVVTIPNAALRTNRDVGSAAQVLGLDPKAVQAQLAASRSAPVDTVAQRTDAASEAAPAAARGNTMTLPNGREVTLPEGVSADQVRAAMQKRMSGGELSAAERAMLGRVFGGGRGGRSGGGGGGGFDGARSGQRTSAFGGRFIVFALQSGKPEPREIQTGLTDLDYVEVVSGLTDQDTVLVLPSASLVNSQKEMRERMQRMQGGGGLPGMQQQQQRPANGTSGSGTRASR